MDQHSIGPTEVSTYSIYNVLSHISKGMTEQTTRPNQTKQNPQRQQQ